MWSEIRQVDVEELKCKHWKAEQIQEKYKTNPINKKEYEIILWIKRVLKQILNLVQKHFFFKAHNLDMSTSTVTDGGVLKYC